MARKAPKTPGSKQSGLVVGVSDYPAPVTKLPAVAADVREMAKLLVSDNGTFRAATVSVLTDKQATRRRILDNLEKTFTAAAADETVFVYVAGHGDVAGGEYFFIAYDTDIGNLSATGVPLKQIKALFDRTPSRRVLMWLDFCHSGGILARNVNTDDLAAIRRALEVVKGEGKVIVAACTPSQSAYESPAVGHGLFTHALLNGLRGAAKSAQGEVTALSLYEFIDHQVASTRQQPVFFGQMTGRIVLMHYPNRGSENAANEALSTKKIRKRAKAAGTWIMLGDGFVLAESVRTQSNGKVEVAVSPTDGEEEAFLASLRPGSHGSRSSLPFAVNNDAYLVRVDQVHSETVAGRQLWTLSFLAESRSNNPLTEMTVNGISPGEIARRRAGRILIDDPPYQEDSRRSLSTESLVEASIEGMNTRYPVRECIIRSIFQQLGRRADWKEFARLKSVFLLKVTDTIEHVVELTLGAVRNNRIEVKFRGHRPKRFSNVPAETIEISGFCTLK